MVTLGIAGEDGVVVLGMAGAGGFMTEATALTTSPPFHPLLNIMNNNLHLLLFLRINIDIKDYLSSPFFSNALYFSPMWLYSMLNLNMFPVNVF